MKPHRPDSGRLIAGRREHSRLRVRLPGRLTTLDGTTSAILVDLSFGGAKVLVDREIRTGQQAVLSWDRFEAFGTMSWSEGSICGLTFDEYLAGEVLIATRDLDDADHMPSDRELMRGIARDWVEGHRRL